jgi:hypothetical protein
MTTSPIPVLVQKPNRGIAQITNATGTTPQTIYTGGANGSKIVSLVLTSTDTVAQNVQIALVNSSTSYILGTVPVPAGAGNGGTVASVNAFSSTVIPGLPIDSAGQYYLFLASASDTITIVPLTTISSAKIISGIMIAGDF